MDATHTFHQNQNNSELKRISLTIGVVMSSASRVLPHAFDIVYAQASHERANLSPLNSEPIHLAVSAAENHFQLA